MFAGHDEHMVSKYGLWPLFFSIALYAGVIRSEHLPGGLDQDPRSGSVLEQHFIHVFGAGRVGVAFDRAVAMLERPDLLSDIQTAYAELLGEGETPEFEIKLTGPGEYFFENRKKQTTKIQEMFRGRNDREGMDFVIYAEGNRSFGDFKSLTHVRVNACPEDPRHTLWEVNVYAYPENRVSRFVARNFGIARRFFRAKTKEISELAVEISRYFVESGLVSAD